MYTSGELLRTLDLNRGQIERFGVRELALFGSYARGEASESSDLDFLVTFEETTHDAFLGLKACLEPIFDHRVDLAIKDDLKPRLRETILREAVHAAGL